MYKLVLLDLDGTLLNQEEKISEEDKKYIIENKEKILVCLVSARSFIRIIPYLEELDLVKSEFYTIAFNGSVITNNRGEFLLDFKIEKEKVINLISFVKQYPTLEWFIYNKKEKRKISEIKQTKEFINKNDIYKVIAKGTEIDIQSLKEKIPERIKNQFQVTASTKTTIEFVDKKVNKKKAILYLLKKLDIKKEEVIAIGDGENDIEMIEFVGCGIAMGNAIQEVKNVANFITDTNEKNGVSKALRRILKE